MEYRLDDLTLTLPDTTWRDRSVISLEAELPNGGPMTLEIVRADVVSPERLGLRVDGEIAENKRQMRGFELLGREDFRASEVEGTSIAFRSVTTEGALHHEVAYVPLPEVLLVFAVTGRVADSGACRDLIVGAIDSIQLRGSQPLSRRV